VTDYPTGVDTFTTGGATDPKNNPSLPEWAEKISEAVVELQKKLGTGASTPVTGQVPVGQSGGGSLWQEFVPIPSGLIAIWSGTEATIPSGWVLCNGTNGTPDLRDRFVVGSGSTYAVGATGGAANVSLTTAQLPSHNHSGNSSNTGGHAHTSGNLSGASHTHGSGNLTGTSHTHGSGNLNTGSTTVSGGAHTHTLGSMTGNVNNHTHNSNSTSASNRVQHPHFEEFWSSIMKTTSSDTHSHGTHSHNISGNSGANTPGVSGNTAGSGVGVSGNTGSTGDHSHTITVGNTGSGSAHENRPPYYALAFIMKL